MRLTSDDAVGIGGGDRGIGAKMTVTMKGAPPLHVVTDAPGFGFRNGLVAWVFLLLLNTQRSLHPCSLSLCFPDVLPFLLSVLLSIVNCWFRDRPSLHCCAMPSPPSCSPDDSARDGIVFYSWHTGVHVVTHDEIPCFGGPAYQIYPPPPLTSFPAREQCSCGFRPYKAFSRTTTLSPRD